MIKVLHDWEGPGIPPGFLRALRLISPKLSLLWYGKDERWLIVTRSVPKAVFKSGYVVEHIVQNKGQFAPLDGRVILALQRARYERDNMRSLDHHLQDIDRRHQEKAERAQAQRIEGFQEFAKKAVKFNTTKTFI